MLHVFFMLRLRAAMELYNYEVQLVLLLLSIAYLLLVSPVVRNQNVQFNVGTYLLKAKTSTYKSFRMCYTMEWTREKLSPL